MKKPLLLVLTLVYLMLLSSPASAHNWHNDSHYDRDKHWQHTRHNDFESDRGLPFAWHDRYKTMKKHYQLERMGDREWGRRFPGLRAYKWSSPEGFWHHGRYIQDAVFFYDRNNELVSIGYMADGVFVYFRDDHESYENHDSFFFSWFHR